MYLVILPRGASAGDSNGGDPGVGGHWFDKNQKVYFGWVLSGREKAVTERITSSLSEEIVEAITDPEPPTGWVSVDADETTEELCDVCDGVTYRLEDPADPRKLALVKTYYSMTTGDCFP